MRHREKNIMAQLPAISKELIEYLETICPDQAPRLDTAERNIWFNAGKVDLVRHLRSVFDEQNETVLQGN